MLKALQRLSVLAIWLLGGVLAAGLAAQISPRGRAPAQDEWSGDAWPWPQTLQVYPANPGDPVKLVRIMKDGKEVFPGTYIRPEMSEDYSSSSNPVEDWLRDASFVLKNQTWKTIVCVGISVVFPARMTGIECSSITGSKSAREPWCEAHPHWCDGGCPELIHNTLHWGLIPGPTASGLEARYARDRANGKYWRTLLQGKAPLRLAPGEEITLCKDGRADGAMTHTDPRHGFSDTMNGIVGNEGIEEAMGTEPCLDRINSKKGCAFLEVSMFNIGVDVVYFEDGTIWGNYGYGYALPGPDGIFKRVDAHDFPDFVTPPPATK